MKKNYGILYDADTFTDAFYEEDPDAAIGAAIDVLIGWMDSERAEWGSDGPTPAQIDEWNYMIGTYTVFVWKVVPGQDEPEEEDVIWDMNDDDLREIGWEEIEK